MIVDHERHIDTLSIADRLALRTNTIDWLLLTPNIGIEFDIRNTNYNRNAIGLNIKYNWQTSHTYKPGVVYNIAEARIDFRNYFRVKEMVWDSNKKEYEWNSAPHKHIWDKPFSARHKKSKHPDAVFYRGAYLAFTKYSVKFGPEGRQGNAISAGYQFGMVKPLYVFRNGHSIDLDLGAAIGITYTSYNKYRLDRESDCYPDVGKVSGQILPMVNELRCALVYRLGKTPGTSKYRWRYDVDIPYMMMKDSIHTAKVAHRQELYNTDSIQSMIRKEFWVIYDSLLVIERANTDSLNKIKLREQKAQAELLKSQKEADKEKKKADKAAAKLKGKEAGNALPETPEGDSDTNQQPPAEPKQQAEAPQPEESEETAAPQDSGTPDSGTEAGTAEEAAETKETEPDSGKQETTKQDDDNTAPREEGNKEDGKEGSDENE